jgi:glutamine---fructose-6-phosphate transaminase (isomerizing)
MAANNDAKTLLRKEIDEIPKAARRLISGSLLQARLIGNRLRDIDPGFVATVARGSSDHAAGFLKYAIELETGVPVASLGPSLASVYGRQMHMEGSATLLISQSGQSPDLVAMAANMRRGGSLTIALTNVHSSPLVAECALALDIAAGPELSVAASKTFVNSVIAGLLILSAWTGNAVLQAAIEALPDAISEAIDKAWLPLQEALAGQTSLYILGRGPTLPIAAEAALKFKETCGLHAEAYSAAEVMHGPVSIIGVDFPVLVLIAHDQSERLTAATAEQLAAQGARVFATSASLQNVQMLPFAMTGHYLTDALVQIVSLYGFVERLARLRGLDPDKPRFLRKVTETI